MTGALGRQGAGRGESRSWAGPLQALLLALLLLLQPGRSWAQAGPGKAELIGPQPAWVKPVEMPSEKSSLTEQARQGIYYLLVDTQVRVDATGRQSFRRIAMQALNEKGVESAANLELRFDPSYERLQLHRITVHRAGQRSERLASTALRVLQREKELDYLIYDGSKTLNAFLEDIRVGDVVEYAYTLSGSNPVFEGRHFGQFDLQWSSPVAKLYARLSWPAGRPVNFKLLNKAPAAKQTSRDGQDEYEWQQNGLAALSLDNDVPSWYDPYQAVQWGEFASWAEVARWALPLYRVPDRLSPALQAEVKRIAGKFSQPAQRAAEALRLVQREVRYLGVEVGVGSHAPNPPSQVFERRFGDCKDKTLLTLTLFKALGLQARAALVHTQMRQGIEGLLPRPSAFNHVIVRADIDGKSYWLDPTRNTQPGELDQMAQSNFGRALLVDAKTQALESVASSPAMQQWRRVNVLLDVRAGLDKAVSMTVKTELQGLSAEQQRALLAGENPKELQQRYLNYYARSYPGLKVVKPFETKDLPGSNRMELLEFYEIPNFFTRSETAHRLEAGLEVPELLSYLQAPRDTIRTAPLALAYPQEIEHVIELMLPEAWTFKDEEQLIEDPGFSLSRKIKGGEQSVRIVDHYQSLADHVRPADVPSFTANLEKARKSLGYLIYKNDSVSGSPRKQGASLNIAVALSAVLLSGLFVGLALRLYAWNPRKRWTAEADASARPLGGWLLLLGLGVLVTPLRAGRQLLENAGSYSMESWTYFTLPDSAGFHVLTGPLMLLELAVLLAQLVFGVLLILLFLKRRSSMPVVYLVLMWGSVLVGALDAWALNSIPQFAGKAGKAGEESGLVQQAWGVIFLGIWTAYLLHSERVRQTFVHGYSTAQGAGAAPLSDAFPPLPQSGGVA